MPLAPAMVTPGPRSDCTATAPIARITAGLTRVSSASSHGLHAFISLTRGFLWIRRLPRGSQLKCFTALVRYSRIRVEAGLGERAIEHRAGRTDEGLPRAIFHVTGLLADQDDVRARRPFAEDHLRRGFVERTGLAVLRRLGQRAKRPHRRHRIRGAFAREGIRFYRIARQPAGAHAPSNLCHAVL